MTATAFDQRQTALIADATTLVGQAVTREFAKLHFHLLLGHPGPAEVLADFKNELQQTFGATVTPVDLPASQPELLQLKLKEQEAVLARADVLFNNIHTDFVCNSLLTSEPTRIFAAIDVNVLASFLISRSIAQHMIKKNKGHIFVLRPAMNGETDLSNFGLEACAAADSALTEGMRLDFFETQIRVTSIACSPHLNPSDIANSVAWMALQPKHVLIQEIVITPSGNEVHDSQDRVMFKPSPGSH